MSLYLVSYHAATGGKVEYGPLRAALEAMGGMEIMPSQWVVSGAFGDIELQKIYDRLQPLLTQKDRLLAVEIVRPAFWDKLLVGDATARSIFNNARLPDGRQ